MPTTLSPEATALFRLHVMRRGQIAVDDANRDSYLELEAAGLVIYRRPFTGNRFYSLTELGRRTGDAVTSPLLSESA